MQACQFGHWEVVQILMLFRANVGFFFSLFPYFLFVMIMALNACFVPFILFSFLGQYLSIVIQIHKTDYINGGTALHFAALNGHSRCIRLLLVDYVPSLPSFQSIMRRPNTEVPTLEFDKG